MMACLMFGIVLGLLTTVVSEKILILDEPLSTQILSLGHLHPQFRQKRSTDTFSFPGEINLHFPLGETQVNIPLSRRNFRGIPKVITGLGTESNYFDIVKTHAIYQNPDHGAAITMRCKDLTSESCELYGTFYHGGGLYQLQPVAVGIYSDYEVSRINPKRRQFAEVNQVTEKLARSPSKSAPSHNREKRAVDDPNPPAYVAEMYLAMDYSLYLRFMSQVDTEQSALINMVLYAVGVMNEVDTRTRNIRIQFVENRQGRNIQDFDLGVVMNTLLICKSPSTSNCAWSTDLVVNGILGTDSLVAFSTSLDDLTGNSTLFDFAVGLTGYDTDDTAHSGGQTMGIYYTEGDICINTNLSLVASITEVNDGGAGFNIAHFLGRHLGSFGDGQIGSSCAAENFIMSPTWDSTLGNTLTMTNPYRWSSCSLEAIYDRIQRSFADNDLDCLKQNSFLDSEYVDLRSSTDLGQIFNLTVQCEIGITNGSFFCGAQQESLCWEGALCSNPSNGDACELPIAVLDGTPCHPDGDTYPEKTCEMGTCVAGTTTPPPTTTTTTPTTTTTTPTTTTTTPTTTTTTPTTTTTTPTTTTTTPTTTTTTPTTTTTTPTTTTTTPTTTTTTPTTTTTTPTTTTTTPTTTTTTPTTTTTTPTTTTTTPTTTTTTPTTTTTTPTTTTTTPTTTTTTPTTTTTTPTTTTTTPTTTTTTPTTTTTTPTTTTTTPTTTTTTPTTTTTTPTTTTTTPTTTTTTPTTTTTTPTTTTTTPTTTTTTPTTTTTTPTTTTTTPTTTTTTPTTTTTTPTTTTTTPTTTTTTPTTTTTTPTTTTTTPTTTTTTPTTTTTTPTTTTTTPTTTTTTPTTTTTTPTTTTTTPTTITTPTTTTVASTTPSLERCIDIGLKCDQNARCVKEFGALMCKCNPGYYGNGEYCEIDMCTQPGQCDVNAKCINTIGSFICVCIDGFVGDGSTCQAKACVTGEAGCSPNAYCITEPGTYRCECKPGFQGDGYKCVSTTPAVPSIRRYSDTSMLGRMYRSTNMEQIPVGRDMQPYPQPTTGPIPTYSSPMTSYPSPSPSYSSPSTSYSSPSTTQSIKMAKSSKKNAKSSKKVKSSKRRSGLSMAQQPFLYGPSNMFRNIQKAMGPAGVGKYYH